MKRRTFLLGTGLAAVGATALLKEGDEGGPYSPYFAKLNRALQDKGLAHPCMLIDLDKMDANIDAVRTSIQSPKTYRIVVKSLPCVPMLQYIMKRANTRSLMVFHQSFLNSVAKQIPNADVLMGKPQPIAAAATFYSKLEPGEFNPSRQLQWLIDTPERLREYQFLAQSLGIKMRIALELDIGLHRGGFSSSEQLTSTMDIIATDPGHLEFSGFMGYEPHIVKMPSLDTAFRQAKNRYLELYDVANSHRPELFKDSVMRNIAGSQTYQLYHDEPFFNDLCVGSGLVMPTDFDMPTLANHQAAAFIATPVLKKYDSVQLSGLEWASGLFSAWNPNRQQAFYIYGGNWQAEYENPPGMKRNPLWGHSSNQEMMTASNKVQLNVDDYVFLRPRQSEFVFLQFGDLVTIRGGEIKDFWAVFQQKS